jgi:FkbM family methyltransferase
MSDRYFTYKTLSNEHILEKVRGVIHVGANYGQEREVYARHGLLVHWIEPITSIFLELIENVSEPKFSYQRAYPFAAWDDDDPNLPFHVTNNEGQSSSAFELDCHLDVWPEVKEVETVTVRGMKLDSFYKTYTIDVPHLDMLVIDAQGAELRVLRGAIETLSRMKFVQVETADFELYDGCARLSEIDAFMREHGFKEMSRASFSPRPDIGQCYEVLYERI